MGKRNELTPFGQTVASRARRMVLDAVELKRSAQLLQEGYLGVIRIGLGAGPTALLMQPFLRYMASMHPRVQVSLESGPPSCRPTACANVDSTHWSWIYAASRLLMTF